MPRCEEAGVGDEEIVADELGFLAHGVGEFFPAGPVVFGEAVLDGDDRELGLEFLVIGDQFVDSLFEPSDFLKTYFFDLAS